MLVKDAYTRCTKTLEPQFGERESRLLVRILLEDTFNVKLPYSDQVFNAVQLQHVETLLQRIIAGEPIQYVTGVSYFMGHSFHVNPAVLIPRPETEELASWVIESISKHSTVLDIGTGSGCLAISIKKALPSVQMYAMDISEEALQTAATNAQQLETTIHLLHADILHQQVWQDMPKVECIVSNPPYIPPSERVHMPAQVIQHEPSLALFSPEEDPLVFYRVIARNAKTYLPKGGQLFFELNEFRAEAIYNILQVLQYSVIELRNDISGKPRMIKAII